MPSTSLGFYSIASLVGEIGQNIWLPLWLDATNVNSTSRSGQDVGTYGVIVIQSIFIFLIYLILYLIFSRKRIDYNKKIINVSVLYFLSTFMTAYTSNSSRNSPTMQSLLSNLCVPLLAIIRLFWFKKIPTCKKFICIVLITVGFLISMIPDIFSMKDKPNSHNTDQISKFGHFMWIISYIIFSVIMPLIVNIYVEDILKAGKNDSNFQYTIISEFDMFSEQIMPLEENKEMDVITLRFAISVLFLGFPLLYWIDVIPNIGYSKDMKDFWENFSNTGMCSIGKKGCRTETIYFSISFIISLILSNIAGGFVIKDGEGSLFWGLVNNLANPLSVLFWILFKSNPLRWSPNFKKQDWYIIAGLFIMLPPLFIYGADDREIHVEWEPTGHKFFGIEMKRLSIMDREVLDNVIIA